MNRATIAVVGATLMVLTGSLTLPQAYAAIDADNAADTGARCRVDRLDGRLRSSWKATCEVRPAVVAFYFVACSSFASAACAGANAGSIASARCHFVRASP